MRRRFANPYALTSFDGCRGCRGCRGTRTRSKEVTLPVGRVVARNATLPTRDGLSLPRLLLILLLFTSHRRQCRNVASVVDRRTGYREVDSEEETHLTEDLVAWEVRVGDAW